MENTATTMQGASMRELRVFVAGATDRGRVREQNEDQFVVAQMTRAMHILGSSLPQPQTLFGERIRGHLMIVADGMGGHNAGEQASALAVFTIEDFLLNTLRWFFRLQGDDVLSEFQQAVRAADDRIFLAAAHEPTLRGMGTTVTLAYSVDSTLYVVHVGDSRLYVMRQGGLYQITQDHTVVGELVRQHIIDEEAAANHPMRHVITNAVGGQSPGVNPEVHKLPLEPDDVLLLCSDGLHEMVPDTEIRSILTAERDVQVACARLVARANEMGGGDNITCIVAQLKT